MIGRWMRALPDRALWRIVEAPAETWRPGCVLWGGRGCLLGQAAGHVSGEKPMWAEGDPVYDAADRYGLLGPDNRFDRLCACIGLDRTRRLCQNAATRVLMERWREAGEVGTPPDKRTREHAKV